MSGLRAAGPHEGGLGEGGRGHRDGGQDPLAGPSQFTDTAAGPRLAQVTGFTDRAALTAELELLAFRGWTALRTETVDGWVLRDSDGATRRGNSVWPRGDVASLPAALDAVDEFYAAAGRPAIVQLTPVSRPAGLRRALDVAGYEADSGPTDVCVADLAEVVVAAATGRGEVGLPRQPAAVPRIQLAGSPDETWLDLCAGGGMSMFGAHRAASVAVLAKIATPAVYVTATVDAVPVGAGRGVVDGDWLGVYSIATLPAARRQGVGTAVVTALASWGAAQGARRIHLQVEETSTAARRMYVALGFLPVYRYTYRRRPLQRSAG